MKNFTSILVLLLITTFSHSSFAGPGDPVKKFIFTDFPHSVNIPVELLENTLKIKSGEIVDFPITEKLSFKGRVISNEYKYSNLQTMIIRADQNNKTLFQLSKIINNDKTVTYSGRIINTEKMDVYEIKKDLNGNYRMQKTDLDKLLQDCSY